MGFSNPFRSGLQTVLCGLVLLTGANAWSAETVKLTDATFMEIDGELKGAEGHPNEEWRLNGLKAYLSGRYDRAIECFERAATYADKYSQHYLSLIYWYGQGTAKDPVRAYIWSDLAAERGGRRLLAIREKMWTQLTPVQQQQVAAQGPAYYEKYGDDVTKPRAEAEIRRFATHMTGSRTGFSNQNIDIQNGGPMNGSFGNATPGMLAASVMVNGSSNESEMYSAARTQIKAYWMDQDRKLDQREGDVDIGPLQNAK